MCIINSCMCASCLCISYMHTSRALSSLHHGVCIIEPASWQMHHITCTVSFVWRSPSLHCIGPAIIPLKSPLLSWLLSICIMSLNILSLSLSIVALHGHKQACFAISIVQQIQIVNPEQGCLKTSFLNRSFMLYSLAIDKPCDESHDNCFLMSWSQLYENLIDLSHHHSLFSLSFSSGSENFTWLNYSS